MLNFSSVTYSYPNAPTPAVRDVSFSVAPGEALLCTGRSGCGKSTLIRLANGLAPNYLRGSFQGAVRVAKNSTLDFSPANLADCAGTLFQDPERQFFALKVRAELALSLQWRGHSPEKIREAVGASAKLMGIEDLMEQSIFELSEGQKQKVALAGLLAAKPGLLLLDEPSANLDVESVRELADTLLALKKSGIALFVVDHRLSWMREVADKVLVLDDGGVAAAGDFSLLDDAGLRARHGLRAARVVDAREDLPELASAFATDAAPFFGCEEIDFAYPGGRPIFSGASYSFPPGRIVALLGENGVGKTTLARLLTGLEKPLRGRITAKGEKVRTRNLPRHAQVVLQNAGHQLRMNSVEAELTDAARGAVDNAPEAAASCMERLGIAHLAARHPQSLSGGEKQRLAVACALVRRPLMLILDEPTSGLDGENMGRMAESMDTAAKDGACLLVITHDLELTGRVCTEKLVLRKPVCAA
jgi:energy-coupling factor transport system ATP-binding protein